jgi:hypothetical protein
VELKSCGTATGSGTTGTANFFHSGTRTLIHYGSSSGNGFGPGPNKKCNTKVKKSKLEANSLGNNAAFNIE